MALDDRPLIVRLKFIKKKYTISDEDKNIHASLGGIFTLSKIEAERRPPSRNTLKR